MVHGTPKADVAPPTFFESDIMKKFCLFLVLCLASTVQAQENRVEPLEPQPSPIIIRYYWLEQKDGSHKWVPHIWYPTWDEVRRGVKFRDTTKYRYPRNYYVPPRYSAFDTEVAKGPHYNMKESDKNPFELYSPEWRKWNYEYIQKYSDPVGGQ